MTSDRVRRVVASVLLGLTAIASCEEKPKAKSATSAADRASENGQPAPNAPKAQTSTLATAAGYRTVDPDKDQFHLEFNASMRGSLSDVWATCDVKSLGAMGTGGELLARKIDVAMVTGTATNGVLETKEFGTFKVRSKGMKGVEMLLTEESIAKIREAIRSRGERVTPSKPAK